MAVPIKMQGSNLYTVGVFPRYVVCRASSPANPPASPLPAARFPRPAYWNGACRSAAHCGSGNCLSYILKLWMRLRCECHTLFSSKQNEFRRSLSLNMPCTIIIHEYIPMEALCSLNVLKSTTVFATPKKIQTLILIHSILRLTINTDTI